MGGSHATKLTDAVAEYISLGTWFPFQQSRARDSGKCCKLSTRVTRCQDAHTFQRMLSPPSIIHLRLSWRRNWIPVPPSPLLQTFEPVWVMTRMSWSQVISSTISGSCKSGCYWRGLWPAAILQTTWPTYYVSAPQNGICMIRSRSLSLTMHGTWQMPLYSSAGTM